MFVRYRGIIVILEADMVIENAIKYVKKYLRMIVVGMTIIIP